VFLKGFSKIQIIFGEHFSGIMFQHLSGIMFQQQKLETFFLDAVLYINVCVCVCV